MAAVDRDDTVVMVGADGGHGDGDGDSESESGRAVYVRRLCGQLWPIVAIVAIVAEIVANCGQLWPIWRGPKGFRSVFSVFVCVSYFRGASAPFPPKTQLFWFLPGRSAPTPY